MEVFVARQPIFTDTEEVYGYELLYRNSKSGMYPNINGDQATAEVIINSLMNIGMDSLTGGKPCFINFTENLLMQKLPEYFHPRDVIVEVLETVTPSKEITKICRALKLQGYKIALDDFVLDHNNVHAKELLYLCDFIKVDFLSTTRAERYRIEVMAEHLHKQLLAEKIETREEYEEARKAGYTLFQGYFFSRPVTLSSYDVPPSLLSYYSLLKDLAHTEPNIEKISQIIEQDLSLSYKLLKLINSPAFRPANKIYSVRQAIVLLGLLEIQRWIYVLALREQVGESNPLSNETVKLSLTRAKLCELIGSRIHGSHRSSAFFLTGLFSLMDSILNLPMNKILKDLPLLDEIVEALNGMENEFNSTLNLVKALERGKWNEALFYSNKLHLEESVIGLFYEEACAWTNQLMSESLLYQEEYQSD
ncbi:EAL and HDOD domain-containing protein [Jeotgalibacillus aurantiacus]|uniref:EAL and HDOD domain-containing protein n=1 Tax=Jeotgalibacillus aurantiacus TaxID=2763266 RepID=UPI001D0BBCC9|nr:HDOD domain-containing protein [Jeotgalibacillus aurantiacus]